MHGIADGVLTVTALGNAPAAGQIPDGWEIIQTRVLVQTVKRNIECFPTGVQGLDIANRDIQSATRK